MKKTVLIASLAALSAITASARLNGEGYYRIQNYATQRYVHIIDNRGSINVQSTSADMRAILLKKDNGTVISDPSAVMHIVPVGSQYNIQSQNTGVYEILSVYVSIREDKRYADTYWAYGSKSGVTMYISDTQDDLDVEIGWAAGLKNQDDIIRNWYIKPIDANSDTDYFGVASTVSADGTHYASMYADFPFTTKSSGMEACYVTKIDKTHGIAVYKSFGAEGVAKSTPVFFKCSSAQPTDNRLNIGTGTATAAGNLLKGVYFNSSRTEHINRTAYNANTMRCLGLTAKGKPGFVKADYDYIPANTAYLPVDADCPADLTLMSEAEYAEYLANIPMETESVTLDKTSLSLNVGETATLTATVAPANTSDKTVKWSSDNTAVATVDNSGNVTAAGVGTATITATCGKKSATCKVTVNKLEQSIVWTQELGEVTEGDAITLTATATSGLTVTYTLEGEGSYIFGKTLYVNKAGSLTITATQAGDDKYLAAQPVVKTINVIAGIEGVSAESISVSRQGNRLVISGKDADTVVSVYDLAGKLLYTGTDSSIPLPAATGIVRIGDKTYKIAF